MQEAHDEGIERAAAPASDQPDRVVAHPHEIARFRGAKRTEDDVRRLRKEYTVSLISMHTMASREGVSYSVIRNMLRGKTYAHVT